MFPHAEAGYGKTTLLAEFSRRTRLRTLWYRMDEEDRNWVSVLSYLLAAAVVMIPNRVPNNSMLETRAPGLSPKKIRKMFPGEIANIPPKGPPVFS